MKFDWNKASYSKDELMSAWQISSSVSMVCNELGISVSGSSMEAVRRAAESIGLSEKDRYARGYSKRKRIPLEEILVKDSSYKGTELKKRLWKAGLLPLNCYCGINDIKLLTLDHINGDKRDNRLENLRILCYNCHALTNTFGSKNKSR